MEAKVVKAAKKEENIFWRKCPICVRGNTASPEFKEFLPLIKHIETHLQSEAPKEVIRTGRGKYMREVDVISLLLNVDIVRPTKLKIAPEAHVLLILVAAWLQKALQTFPEMNNILTSNLKVADQLVDFANRLANKFSEQGTYLLEHEGRLRETGMDPKWLRKPGGQVRFIAESMAGAMWNLSPSSSREFIRQRSNKSARTLSTDRYGLIDELIKEGAWWKSERTR